VLVAPELREYESEFNAELIEHKVSAWSIADLEQLLQAAVDPYELRAALVPGLGADHIGQVLWARRHGARAPKSLAYRNDCSCARSKVETERPPATASTPAAGE